MAKLKPKQRKFASEYAKSGHITKAAIKAGYSKKTAHTIGSENLKKPEIAKAVDKALERITEKAELKAADILSELRKLAFVDLSKAYAKDGTLLHPHKMPEDVRLALQAIETLELKRRGGSVFGSVKKIKLHDKVKSLELLGRAFGMFKDVVQTDNTHRIEATPEQINASTEKFLKEKI